MNLTSLGVRESRSSQKFVPDTRIVSSSPDSDRSTFTEPYKHLQRDSLESGWDFPSIRQNSPSRYGGKRAGKQQKFKTIIRLVLCYSEWNVPLILRKRPLKLQLKTVKNEWTRKWKSLLLECMSFYSTLDGVQIKCIRVINIIWAVFAAWYISSKIVWTFLNYCIHGSLWLHLCSLYLLISWIKNVLNKILSNFPLYMEQ